MVERAGADEQPVSLMAIRFDRPVSNAARFSRLLGAFSLVLALAVMIAHRFGGLATPYLVLLLIAAAGCALLSAMALCDQLEARLATAGVTRGNLLDALFAEALTPANNDQRRDAAE